MNNMKNQFFYNTLENVLYGIYIVYRFFNGCIGNRRLRQPYKRIWMFVTWGLFTLFSFIVLFYLCRVWGVFVDKLNFLIWG